MAVPVPCLHGSGLRPGRDQGRQRHLLDRLAEAAFRPERHRALARHSGREGALDLGGRARLLRPQRRRRRRHGRRHLGERGRQAGAGAIHPRPGDRMGPEGPRLHPPRPRRHRRRRQRHRLRVQQQGVLPRRREHQWRQPAGYACRALPRCRAEIGRQFRRAGGILRVRQQAHGVGDDPAAARPRLAAARRASARSGRTADPLRQRIVHGRGGGRARPSIRSSSACATSRTRATSR